MSVYATRLKKIVETIGKKLESLDSQTVALKPGNKWSKKEILGHLIDSARHNHFRIVHAKLKEEYVFSGTTRTDGYRYRNSRK